MSSDTTAPPPHPIVVITIDGDAVMVNGLVRHRRQSHPFRGGYRHRRHNHRHRPLPA